jgi:hypothetical protein
MKILLIGVLLAGSSAQADSVVCRTKAETDIQRAFAQDGSAYPFLEVPADLEESTECLPGGPAPIKTTRSIWIVPGANPQSTSYLNLLWRNYEADFASLPLHYVPAPASLVGTRIGYICEDLDQPISVDTRTYSDAGRPIPDACQEKWSSLVSAFSAKTGCQGLSLGTGPFGRNAAFRSLQCLDIDKENKTGVAWYVLHRCDPSTKNYVKIYQRKDLVDLKCPADPASAS